MGKNAEEAESPRRCNLQSMPRSCPQQENRSGAGAGPIRTLSNFRLSSYLTHYRDGIPGQLGDLIELAR